MEYVNDPQEIEELVAAADRISSWAREQMGQMRRPKPPMDEVPGGDDPALLEDPGAPEGEAMPEDMELEQPMEQPPPPSFGPPKKPGMDVEIEVITPGRGRPRPRDDEEMRRGSKMPVPRRK